MITKVPNEQLETLCYLTYAKKDIFKKKLKTITSQWRRTLTQDIDRLGK